MNHTHGGRHFDPRMKDEHYCFHSGVEGRPGRPGAPGANGYSPTVAVRSVQGGHELCVTDIDGEHVFRVMDGESVVGPQGEQGPQGPKGDRGSAGTVLKSLSLPAAWTGIGPYTQTVTISGYTVTANSKVDLQPDEGVIGRLIADGVQALYVYNFNGTLTACAVGAAPTAALTLQCSITEVTV